jgi:hypothetical protein
MSENAPPLAAKEQPGWIPSRDYLGRRPIVESWPGLRPEIKRTWEALAAAAKAACIVATSGEWFDFFGLSMSGFRARLRSMADLGLIRWSMAEDGSRRITIELIDPLLLARRPVGTAARYSRPRAVVGSFERQVPLFSAESVESRQPLRLAICEEAEAEPVQLQPSDPARVQGPEAEPVQLQKPPDCRSFPPASLPQCPAGARALNDLNDLNEMIIESKGGDGMEKQDAAALAALAGDSSQGQGQGQGDPIEALTCEDFERRREEVAERANAIARRLWRVDQRERIAREDKGFIAKVCFLASAKPCAPYGWTWLDDAVDRVTRSKARKTLDSPAGYLHQVLRKSVDGAGRNFPCDLAVLESIVHRDLFSPAARTPPARASPAPDVPPRLIPPEKLREARDVIAAAREAMRAARSQARKTVFCATCGDEIAVDETRFMVDSLAGSLCRECYENLEGH